MKYSRKRAIIVLSFVLLGLDCSLAAARTLTGPRGSTATGSLESQGNTVSGSGSATGVRGNSLSANGSASYQPVSGTVNGSGSVTGPRGNTRSATVSAGNGSATITGGNGKTRTWSR